MEPLPSYQQFPIVDFRGYESCTRCLAMPRLEHIYIYPFFFRYFGPFGRMSHFSLPILFLIQSGKRGKWNYTIHRKIVTPEHTHIHSFYIDAGNPDSSNAYSIWSKCFWCIMYLTKVMYAQCVTYSTVSQKCHCIGNKCISKTLCCAE
jgi:hypothetical protein